MTEAVSVWSCLLQSVYAPRDGGSVSVVVSAAVCVRALWRRQCQCGRVCCSLCTRLVTEAVSVWSCLLQSVYAPRDGGGVSVVVSAAVCVRTS